MSEPLQRIVAKLDRANKHIGQFEAETNAFLNTDANQSLIYDDPEAKTAFERFHVGRPAPLSLSLIAGEILYQLRSALDHLACALILKGDGTITIQSQFLIEGFKPVKPKDLRRHRAKVAGMEAEPLAVIEGMQPYHLQPERRDAHWLAVLKKLNNFDKHQSLVLHVVRIRQGTHFFVGDPQQSTGPTMTLSYRGGRTRLLEVLNVKPEVTAYIAFGDVAKSKDVEVLPVLQGLAMLTRKTVSALEPFL